MNRRPGKQSESGDDRAAPAGDDDTEPAASFQPESGTEREPPDARQDRKVGEGE